MSVLVPTAGEFPVRAGSDFVYRDSAATSQTTEVGLDAMDGYYRE